MFSRIWFAGLVALSASGWLHSAHAELVQWSGNGHWYEAVYVSEVPQGGGIGWYCAKQKAEELGGHLVTITSAEENAFVYGLVDPAANAENLKFWWPENPNNGSTNWLGPWLGGYQPLPDLYSRPTENWHWVTGETFDYANWGRLPGFNDQPDDNLAGSLRHEDALQFYYKTPKWNDFASNQKNNGYIVEFESAVPEPSTFVALTGLGLFGAIGIWRCRRRNARAA